MCSQCPWRINTNVSSVSWSWGSLSRLSAATASVYTASSSSPGRLEVLRPPTAMWNANPFPPNAYTLTGHASAHPVFLFLLTSGNFWHTRSIILYRLILHMTGLHYWSQWITRIWPCGLILKVSIFFSTSLSCHWYAGCSFFSWMHCECITNTLVYHLMSNDALTVSLNIRWQFRELNNLNSQLQQTIFN